MSQQGESTNDWSDKLYSLFGITMGAIVLYLLGTYGCPGENSEADYHQSTDQAGVESDSSLPAATSLSWTEVFRKSGSSNTQTEPFRVGRRWRLTWIYESGDGTEDNFILWLVDPHTGREVELLVNEIGSSGQSEYNGYAAGEFALKVNTQSGYVIKVEDGR